MAGTPSDPLFEPPDIASGRPVRVESTKYDGSMHYQFDAMLLDQAGGAFRIWLPAGTPVNSYRGSGVAGWSQTGLFFQDRWYNVMHNVEPAGRSGILKYANVSTPAILDGDVVRWIDLDVDIACTRNGIEVWDEDEFAEHSAAMAYPDEVIRRVVETRDELVRLAHAGGFPFDRASHLPVAR